MNGGDLPAPSEFACHWVLDPAVVFLNHGSFGACPREVLEAQSRYRAQMEAEPVRFLTCELEPLLDASRKRLARLLNAGPDDLAFVFNATTGVNAVVRSIALQPGDELLTTSHDYNACRNALEAAARRAGARVVVAPVPFPLRGDEEVVNAVLSRVTARTRLAMIDHVTSPTAVIFPITRIVRALEERGIDTLVDGAHAPGMLPIDLAALRPAYYTGHCHKWLCAPKGSGFLYVRADRQERIQPTTISHGYNTPRPGRRAFHDRFDWVGTIDPTAWICVGDAIQWCDALVSGGNQELMRRNHALAVQGREILCEALAVRPPCPDTMIGSMATIPLPPALSTPPLPADKTDPLPARLLDQFGIEVPILRWGEPARPWVRISAYAYNTVAQYRYLAAALKSPVG
jgi:isopenicillin-N epimerase